MMFMSEKFRGFAGSAGKGNLLQDKADGIRARLVGDVVVCIWV
jgi:hypothetical protein